MYCMLGNELNLRIGLFLLWNRNRNRNDIFSNLHAHTVKLMRYDIVNSTCGLEGGHIAKSCFHLTPAGCRYSWTERDNFT